MEDQQNPAPVEAGDEVVTEQPVTETPVEPEAAENTEGQADETPPASEPEGDEEQVSPSKARRERRKAELQRLKDSEAEARRELERTQQRLQRMEQLAQSSQPPKREDYANQDDYLAARAAFSSLSAMDDRQKRELQEEAARQTQALQGISQREQQEMAQNWADQTADAKTRYADFDQVVSAPDLTITQQMARIITTSDVGADVAYYLGTNKAEAARIAQMSDIDMGRALGAIEARVSVPKVKTQTTAPDPVKPVRPKATAQKRPEDMTVAEFNKWRESGGTVKL